MQRLKGENESQPSTIQSLYKKPENESQPIVKQPLKKTPENSNSDLGKKPCRYFKRGYCHFGNNCTFSHEKTPVSTTDSEKNRQNNHSTPMLENDKVKNSGDMKKRAGDWFCENPECNGFMNFKHRPTCLLCKEPKPAEHHSGWFV